jgi:hypothetical protein
MMRSKCQVADSSNQWHGRSIVVISPRIRGSFRAGAIALIAVFALGVALAMAPVIGGAATLQLPQGVSRDLAYTMYGEQVDSAENIGVLVAGRMKSFDVLDSDVTSTTAALDLKVTLTNGLTRSGVMNLVKVEDTWYFESIWRTDRPDAVGFEDEPDIGVLNTMLAEQSKNDRLISKLVDGSFTTVAVGTPKKGYRSVDIPVTFSGKGKSARGKVTAVKRMQDGRAQWFVVSFR